MENKANPNYFALTLKYYKWEKVFQKVGFFIAVLMGLIKLGYIGIILDYLGILILPIIRWNRKNCQECSDTNRRKDFFDNSFDTKLIETRTKDYYDNNEQEVGLYKALVNVFENSLFSSTIATKMLEKRKVENGIFIGVGIVLTILGIAKEDWITVFVALFYIFWYVLDLVTLRRYTSKVVGIHSKLYKLFQERSVKKALSERNMEGDVIFVLMEYETNISQNCIMLDSKLFSELNEELSEKWEKMKREFEI